MPTETKHTLEYVKLGDKYKDFKMVLLVHWIHLDGCHQVSFQANFKCCEVGYEFFIFKIIPQFGEAEQG